MWGLISLNSDKAKQSAKVDRRQILDYKRDVFDRCGFVDAANEVAFVKAEGHDKCFQILFLSEGIKCCRRCDIDVKVEWVELEHIVK